ncbi:hypothetical protein GOP96_07270 [Vibrio cholerae]|uniref:ATPase, T2SS/T4P/T4SS family n=1 Tax=Vibrio cholerae TaxID=666 RepID=UPI000E6A892B|nr:ATPase, T2SS/T4P/T4SS family [Vibrio cholerae]MEB5526841.1 hypothetical protein [Vibrio cholerae]
MTSNDFGLELDKIDLPNFIDDSKVVIETTNNCEQLNNRNSYNLNVQEQLVDQPIWNDALYRQLHDTKVFSRDNLDQIFEVVDRVYGTKVSDVVFPSENSVYIKVDKLLIPLFNRQITKTEIEQFISKVLGDEAVYDLKNPDNDDIDESYNALLSDKLLRYRLNACRYREPIGSQGYKLTFRSLPSKVPTFDDYNVPDFIRRNSSPSKGLVIIAGPTGSGKTTLCAAILDSINKDANYPRFVLAYEQPPEYLLGSLKGPNPIFQHAVGKYKDMKNFAAALRNSLRNAPGVIFSGETRDAETFEILPRIAESGHLAITTTHAGTVSGILTRVSNEVSGDKEQIIRNFITYAHLFVVQNLVRTVEGRMTPVHEWLLFDDEIKKHLLSLPKGHDLVTEVNSLVIKNGKPLKEDLTNLYESGIISEFTFRRHLSGDM